MTPRSDRSPAKWLVLAATLLASMLPSSASAADDVSLELRPHCDSGMWENSFGGPMPDIPGTTTPSDGRCYAFQTKDPLTKQTQVLDEGSELDMDLVLKNPSKRDITRFRAWLSYDPTILEGVSVDIDDSYPTPTPGESDFSPDDGFVKIGASGGSEDDETIVLARIKMKVIDEPGTNTIIAFYDTQSEDQSHTLVMTGEGDAEENILETPLGVLLVRLRGVDGSDGGNGGDGEASSAAASENESSESAATASSVAQQAASAPASQAANSQQATGQAGGTLFSLLQVQNLRATTEGTSVYLAWDALNSAELAGYNVYYNTVSGTYIHRRGVDKGSTTLTVRNLNAGKKYFFAVRAVNAEGVESEFSQEVGIVIGNPATSTSPLASITDQGPRGQAPGNDGKLAGDTGPTSLLVLLVAASAVIGTSLAFRRQFVAVARA
jgi:hypothetical protein